MDFVQVNDGSNLFYRDRGEGTPVILIHGWPLNGDMFEYQTLALLKNGFRVITYDRRGFGRSDQSAFGYDYNTFADDLHSLIEHLGLEKVALVGFSMGGGEVARYISRHGTERVSSATLISAVTPYLLKDTSNPEGVEEGEFRQMMALIEEDRPAFLAQFTKHFFGVSLMKHPVSQETQNWCFNMAMMASLRATIECVKAFGFTDFRQDLKAFDIPTLIVHGLEDKVVPIEISGEAVAKQISAAKFKIYNDAPHGLFITHKLQLNDDLIQFLQSHRLTQGVPELSAGRKKMSEEKNIRPH